jgi:ParB family chromosome partitioning protein
VEEIVSTGGAKVKAGSIRSGKIIAPKLKEISDQLSDHLDTRVSVELGKQKGKIIIEFATVEDLERIVKRVIE